MKKFIYIAASLFLTITMQAQDRPQPKAGPAPTININKPQSFVLKNGLKVLVVENHKLPRVSFNLTLDNPPYAEGNKKGVSDILSGMLGNGTETITKDVFNEEIDFLGASINFYASGASGNGLSRYSKRILELMADGALNPLFDKAEFEKEKEKIIEGLKADEKSVSAIARRVEDVLVFGKDHYRGEYTSEETLKNVTFDDVILNYNTYFVPANAYLVIVGDVNFKEVKKEVERLFGSWKKATAPQLSYTAPKDVQYSQINFIDTPNAVQSEIALVNLSNLKMTDKEYFSVLLANQILGGGGEGRLFLNLREKHGWTYGAYSSIGSGKYISKFRSSASVRNTVTDSAVVEFFNEIKRIKTDLVSEEDLRNAKAKYVGNFVMQIEKPSTIAGYALNKETQGLPEDFYENYIKNINAVTAEDIKNAANKYFLSDKTRVVIVGKAGDVLPGLEAMSKREKLPIFYFDKYGNPTEKPEVKKPVPAGVTAQTVLNTYINSIGGEKAVKNVKTLAVMSAGTVQGTPLELVVKTAPKKMGVEMKAMGMTMMKQVVNEKEAYMVQQGQRKDFKDQDLKDMQAEATTFKELALLTDKDVTLTGIENINGADAYAIKNGKSTYYYDVKTGFKVAEAKELEQGGQKMTQTTYYQDYKDVKGLKFPYKTIMNVGIEIELITTEVKINEGVTDADFK
ncbi:M16 family metallopeptidase [Flavobacterium cheniae]|uniref:Putative Zn-dependent peptidase n=1 Tax=Flavobacterium cheniae TaxID=295428 RepID=A0A562KFP3_9FLAO|nr:pitrilysin family protein [Flavobacterium cheniae]TDR20894.1 putative Zn-dependent peptidase [Flavobacterium cheniae]TWH94230.1 putative Zn-dependent peptidase [Flavobacterium cheniae]